MNNLMAIFLSVQFTVIGVHGWTGAPAACRAVAARTVGGGGAIHRLRRVAVDSVRDPTRRRNTATKMNAQVKNILKRCPDRGNSNLG